MINKIDQAAPDALLALRGAHTDAVFVSARTGGDRGAARRLEERLPRPEVEEVEALVPYDRGDLINRIHQSGGVPLHRAHGRRHPVERGCA